MSGKLLATLLVAGLIAGGIVLLAMTWPSTPRSTACSGVPPAAQNTSLDTFVVMKCGTTTDVAPGGHFTQELPRLSDTESVAGQFAANRTVVAYMMDPTDLSNFSALPPGTYPSHYLWSSGNVSAGNISFRLPGSPATVYLVYFDPSGTVPAMVTETEVLEMLYLPTSPA